MPIPIIFKNTMPEVAKPPITTASNSAALVMMRTLRCKPLATAVVLSPVRSHSSRTRLYGTVTLKVFKHMDLGVIASGALFRAMLEDTGRDLGFGDDWPRLRALTEAEMSR